MRLIPSASLASIALLSLLANSAVGQPVPASDEPGAQLETERNTVAVFKSAAPSTVYVTQNRVRRNGWALQEVEAGSGSGYVWDTAGHIVTNYHVISGGRSFSVTLFGGKMYPAVLIGGEAKRDIAVLKIDAPAEALFPIAMPPKGHSLDVGQKAIAIGNPFGLDHTLTVGVVSALGRDLKGFGGVTIRGMVQTDASINPGNSGGPLLDSQGRLIGMNTMIHSSSGSSAGIGFAVPVDVVRRLVPQIIRSGHAERAGFGIEIVSDEVARRNRVKAGVIVERVAPGTPAAKAGIRGLRRVRRATFIGDIIIAIEDKAIADYDDLYNVLEEFRPGDEVRVTLKSEAGVREVRLKLMLLR